MDDSIRFVFQEQLVEFNQLAIEHANGHEDMLNRVMTKDNIALAALLQTKEACWENGVPPDHKVLAETLISLQDSYYPSKQ